MNKRQLIYGALIGMMALTASCSKYGTEFADGYQSGDPNESPLTTDTTMGKADKSLYHRARIYPGLVGEKVARIQDTTISLQLNRAYVDKTELKVASTPVPVYTTGLYAPAGEVIRITVPAGMIGLTAHVGVHIDNITGVDAPRRDALLYTQKELFPGTNYIKNLYGGTLWIMTTQQQTAPVALKVAGAVKSTDFTLGKSNVADWKKAVLAQDVPWMDLVGERVIFSVPRTLVTKFIQSGKLDQVDEALRLWDETYEKDYYDWMGLSATAADKKNRYPDFWERGVMDIHPRYGYAHAGNPWVMQEDDYWFDELTNPNTIRKGTSWGTYHEVGHNYQAPSAWSWSDLIETTNNLFIFNAARNRGNTARIDFHPALKTSIPAALKFAKITSAKSFSNFPSDLGIDANDPFARLTPFLQIFDKAKGKNGESGWDFFPYLYSKARNEDFETGLDQGKRDYFYRQLCNFTGRDFNRFFIAWGIPVSGSAKREMREKYAPMDRAIWNYDPLQFTGGDETLLPKYYLPSGSFEFTANVATATNESTGKFSAMTDGNIGTYWHTCYSGCSVSTELPVELIMNMKEVNAFKGFFFQNRQNNTFATKVQVYISRDNNNWTEMGEYALASATQTRAQNNALREFAFPKLVEAQYVKFVFPEQNTGGQNHVAIAEIGVFYDI